MADLMKRSEIELVLAKNCEGARELCKTIKAINEASAQPDQPTTRRGMATAGVTRLPFRKGQG